MDRGTVAGSGRRGGAGGVDSGEPSAGDVRQGLRRDGIPARQKSHVWRDPIAASTARAGLRRSVHGGSPGAAGRLGRPLLRGPGRKTAGGAVAMTDVLLYWRDYRKN